MLYCKCCIYEALFRNEILPCVYHRRLHLEMHYNFFGDTFHKSRHLGFHYDGKLCVSKVSSNLTLLCHIYHNSLLFCGGLILHAYWLPLTKENLFHRLHNWNLNAFHDVEARDLLQGISFLNVLFQQHLIIMAQNIRPWHIFW